MGLGSFKAKLLGLGKAHTDTVEQGIDKGGEAAEERFGHKQQVDQAAEKGKEHFRDEDGPEPGAPQ